jgi:hypothetical protein
MSQLAKAIRKINGGIMKVRVQSKRRVQNILSFKNKLWFLKPIRENFTFSELNEETHQFIYAPTRFGMSFFRPPK